MLPPSVSKKATGVNSRAPSVALLIRLILSGSTPPRSLSLPRDLALLRQCGDTKKAASLRASGPLDSGVADALAVEDPVYPGHNVLGIVQTKLELDAMGELKSPFIHRRHQRGRRLLLAGPAGPLALDRLCDCRVCSLEYRTLD